MELSPISNATTVTQAISTANRQQPVAAAENTDNAGPPIADAASVLQRQAETAAAQQSTRGTNGNDKESKNDLEDAISNVNDSLKSLQNQSSALEFTMDHDLGRVIVRLVDTRTKEVIRQYPPEEVLEIARQMDKLVGKLLKEKA